MARTELASVIGPKCQKIADQMGYELVDVSLDQEPTGKYLRIYIDKPEGVTLDDCEKYHKTVMPLLETYDYDFMEVSSPGIDRPLKTDRDFERNLGAEVEVRLFRPVDGAKEWNGILASFDRETVGIDTGSETREFQRKAIALIRPVVDMEGIEDVEFEESENREA